MASFWFSSIVLRSGKTESELQAVPTQLLVSLRHGRKWKKVSN